MNNKKNILKTYWGFDEFRDLQEEIIDTVLGGNDCVALLPTGGGKSLCYQVPALLLPGLTIVVSPLISLMQDQVFHLKQKGVEADFLSSGLKQNEVEEILSAAEKGAIKLLYLSPERLQSKQFKDALPYLNLSLIAVDEAHCISQWGHDFRPEYLQINSIRKVWKNTPIIALTASATEKVLTDIRQQLQLENAHTFKKSFERANINYLVQYSENKNQFIVQHFLRNKQCGIIYCRSRRRTEELSLLLKQNNINAAAYHAGLPRGTRDLVQASWMKDEVPVIVATTAFGMGIDKPGVRTVIHFDAPEHLEAYYQETGRAGRDGEQSEAIALYNFSDIEKLENSTEQYFPPTEYLRKVYQCVCDFLQIPTGTELRDYFDFDLNRFLINFKLEAVPATHALRILAQEGLWTLSESVFRPATVQFIADRQVLDDINARYPMEALVSTGLLRLFTGIFHYPAIVNTFLLARHLNMKKEDVERTLIQLHRMNIIVYEQAKEGPQLYFHHYRVPGKDLILNLNRINTLRENHRYRSEKMIAFLQNKNQCFNKLLLEYFDEESPDSCNHCNYCLGKKNQNVDIRNLPTTIIHLLKLEQTLSLNELIFRLGTESAQTTALIRAMIDNQIITLTEEGELTLTKPGA
ncbi:MAG: ATP-dependent DNA helicase RecQ [Chitinophagaceae bacterium]